MSGYGHTLHKKRSSPAHVGLQTGPVLKQNMSSKIKRSFREEVNVSAVLICNRKTQNTFLKSSFMFLHQLKSSNLYPLQA